MFSQVVIVGDVAEIYATKIDVDVNDNFIPVEINEEQMSRVLLGNNVGIKGHIEMYDNDIPHIICDSLDVLDTRGKSRGIKNGN